MRESGILNKMFKDLEDLETLEKTVHIQRNFRSSKASIVRESMVSTGESWAEIEFTYAKLRENINRSIGGLYFMKLHMHEEVYLQRFIKTNFFATHASRKEGLVQGGNLKLMSLKQLKAREVSTGTVGHRLNTDDHHFTGTEDYIFFSLEAGLAIKKTSSSFGSLLYRVNFGHFHFYCADLLLTDQNMAFENNGCDTGLKYSDPHSLYHGLNLSENSTNTIKEYLRAMKAYNSHYVKANTLGLRMIALHIISIARLIDNDEDKKKLLCCDEDGINRVMNGVFRPEIRVPRFAQFAEGEYTIHPIHDNCTPPDTAVSHTGSSGSVKCDNQQQPGPSSNNRPDFSEHFYFPPKRFKPG